MTSKFGTAEFDSIFPGHYTQRSTHVHSVVREEDGRSTHVGMLYFDELPRMVIEVIQSLHTTVLKLTSASEPSRVQTQPQ